MSLSQSGRTNPLDRNHDGRVSLQDLAPINQGGMYGGMNNKVATNPLDRNHDGRVDLKDLSSNSGMGMNQGKMNHGLGMQQGLGGARHNPLDRNHDGKVDLKDIAPHSGTSQGVGNNPLYNQGMMNEGVMHQGMGMNQGLSSLDRNMDGRVDMQDLSSGAYVQSARRSSVRAEPTLVETIQKEVVVHERIHPVQKEEIQPIIFREREQMEVKQVTQMMHETQIQPTLIQQRELPAERRAAVVERSAPIAENFVAASREVDVTMRSQVVHAPIVNEIVRKTVIEEIQPVLERDVIQSTVIQNTQPIYEKIVEAPQVFRETRVINERRLSGANLDTLVAQGFDLSSMGGLGLTQSTMTSTTYNQSVLPPQMSSELNRGMHSTEMYSSGNVVMNKRKSLVEALPASYGHLMNNEGMMPGNKMMEEQRMRELQASPLPSRTL